MDEPTEERLDALLQAHERIAMDMGEHKIMSEDDPTEHITGGREALLRVEELIHEMVENDD